MRGTGYAIGEILIFLAIAAIIGFLIGWLVFYRRPDKGSSQLSPVNPNHVRRLEERSKVIDAKLGGIEKRANALLQLLAKTPKPGAGTAEASPAATDQAIAPAAAAPIAFEKGEDEAAEEVAPAEDETKDAAAPEDEAKDAETPTTPEDGAEEADTTSTPGDETSDADTTSTPEDETEEAEPSGPQPVADAEDTGDEAEAAAEEPEAKSADLATADSTTPADGADAGVDGYLSEADDRISKLEETLDKLSEKLAELEDD